jgi:hypothetical protein
MLGWMGEKAVLGLDWVQQATKRVAEVRQHMLATQSKEKSCADSKRSNVEFQAGEEVLLRVSPTNDVIRFNIKGKLSPLYIGPFMIVARVGKLAYRLEIHKTMKGVYNVFQVNMLRNHFS